MLIENTSVGFEGFYTFETRNKDTGELTQSLTVKNRITRWGARSLCRESVILSRCLVFTEYIDESKDIVIQSATAGYYVSDTTLRAYNNLTPTTLKDLCTTSFNVNDMSYIEVLFEYALPSTVSGVFKAVAVSDSKCTFSQTNIKNANGDLTTLVVGNSDVLTIRYKLRVYGAWHKPIPSRTVRVDGVNKVFRMEHHPTTFDVLRKPSGGTNNSFGSVFVSSLKDYTLNTGQATTLTLSDGKTISLSNSSYTAKNLDTVESTDYRTTDPNYPNNRVFSNRLEYKNTTSSNITISSFFLIAPFNLIQVTIEGGLVVPPQGTFSMTAEIEWCNTVPPPPPALYTNPTNNKSAINPVTGRAFDINPDY